MASPWAHALAGAAVGAFYQGPERRRVVTLAAICAVLPDLDLIGWPLGVPFQAPLGHRGLTHSIPVAALLGIAAAWGFLRMLPMRERMTAAVILILATVTHGVLDAMTTYSPTGPAFWAPFSNARYRFLWTPLGGGGGFKTAFDQEALYVCLPAIAVIMGIEWWRRTARKTY